MQLCTEDLIIDGPSRERAQYADPYVLIKSMQRLFKDLRPVRRWLRQWARGADHAGVLPTCYPSGDSSDSIPDFQAAYILSVLEYVKISGDIETALVCLPVIEKTLEAFQKHTRDDGLLVDVPGWVFIDNTFQLPRRLGSSGLNAMYAGAIRACAELLTLVGQGTDAEKYREHFISLRHAFRAAYVDENGVRAVLEESAEKEEPHQWQWWNHHAYGAGVPQRQTGGSMWVRADVSSLSGGDYHLAVAHFQGCRVFVNGACVYADSQHGSWARPPLDEPRTIQTECSGVAQVLIEYAHSAIDWEIYIAADSEVRWSDVHMLHADTYGESRQRLRTVHGVRPQCARMNAQSRPR